jgi:NhaP-type Na+/H+ or K+/H+ antiporter
MIKTLTKREKTIFFVTIAVIIFAVIFNFLLSPVLTKGADLNKEIRAAKIKLKKYTRLLVQKKNIELKSQKFSAAVRASEKEDPLVAALSELEAIARDSGVRIVDIRPQGLSAGRAQAAYKEALIDFRSEATMESYLKFIYNLEHSLTLLKIKKFQLSAKPNSASLEGAFTVSQPALE